MKSQQGVSSKQVPLFYHVVGTRPQFIKAVAVTNRFASAGLDYEIVNTGQHFDSNMADDFLKLATRPPKYNLNINSGSHGANTARMIIELERVFLDDQPTHVIVYGDCDTTLAASIAAAKIPSIRLIHLESGCRSGLRYQPEEINRKMVDSISDQLFCATSFDVDNLLREGIPREKIVFCGHLHRELTDRILKGGMLEGQHAVCFADHNPPATNPSQGRPQAEPYYLLTLHRRENMHYDILEHIFGQLGKLDYRVLFLIHPATQKAIERLQVTIPDNFQTQLPVDYGTMIQLILGSHGVITDSGGIRFEALYLQRACCVLRPKTESEWHQLDDLGYLKYLDPSGFDCDEITGFKPQMNSVASLDGIMTGSPLPSEIIVRRLDLN